MNLHSAMYSILYHQVDGIIYSNEYVGPVHKSVWMSYGSVDVSVRILKADHGFRE